MANVFGVHQQVDLVVHGDRHFCGDDVIFGVGIVIGIDTEEILVGFAHHLGMNRGERSIWSGITEVERELSGLDLDRDGIDRWSREVNVGPGFGAEGSERKDFDSYQQEGRPYYGFCAAREGLQFLARLGVREPPDKERKNELRSEERNA